MRISDWSSDVCSSDLKMVGDLPFSPPFQAFIAVHTAVPLQSRDLVIVNSEAIAENCDEPLGYAGMVDVSDEANPRLRSEERRVGKECVPCRSRWSPYP